MLKKVHKINGQNYLLFKNDDPVYLRSANIHFSTPRDKMSLQERNATGQTISISSKFSVN